MLVFRRWRQVLWCANEDDVLWRCSSCTGVKVARGRSRGVSLSLSLPVARALSVSYKHVFSVTTGGTPEL